MKNKNDLIPMPPMDEFEAAKVEENMKRRLLQALHFTRGLVHDACRLVSVPRMYHYRWLRDDPDYKMLFDYVQEGVTDFVESKMFERITGVLVDGGGEDDEFISSDLQDWPEGLDPESIEGREHLERIRKSSLGSLKVYRKPPSENLIAFYLRTKGRSRGYGERTELTGAEGTGLFHGKTDEELLALIQGLTKKLE